MNKAFTLIELLVVVLIIGILAAVAVPQYQKAIYRTRLSNLKAMTQYLEKSVRLFYVANALWPKSLDELDAGFQGEVTAQSQCKIGGEMYCCLLAPVKGGHSGHVICGDKDSLFAYRRYFSDESGNPVDRYGQCVEPLDKAICARILGKSGSTGSQMITPTGFVHCKSYSMN